MRRSLTGAALLGVLLLASAACSPKPPRTSDRSLNGEKNLTKVRGQQVPLHRRSVGVVYQNHQLLMDRSVGENVALPLILRGMKRGEIGKRVRVLLEKLGLAARERALPSQLSAGEQQRVGIARALAAEPPLLVADEPTGNLDPTTSTAVFDSLYELARKTGVAALVAPHNLELASHMDRVFALKDGRLEEQARE